MGFGFNLLCIFILFPLTIIYLILWALTRKVIFGKLLGILSLGIFGMIMSAGIINIIFTKKTLEKEDFYGQYIVNRNYFNGKQADWQYDNFRFEIKENDSIYLYVKNEGGKAKTFKGTIATSKPYGSARLVLKMQEPNYHIFESNPTIYRSTWNFYLVFHSPKFGNMFFKKGEWSDLE